MNIHRDNGDRNYIKTITPVIHQIALLPASVVMVTWALCYFGSIVSAHYFTGQDYVRIDNLLSAIFQFILISGIYWVLLRLLSYSGRWTSDYFANNGYRRITLAIPFVINCINAILVFGFIIFAVDLLPLPKQFVALADKLFGTFIIGAITWILIKLILLLEKYVVIYYRVEDLDDLFAQKAYTQIIFLKRLVIAIILILALGAILMQFNNVRQLGASILASAGVVTIIAGFAIQKVLSVLINGLQIALYQPIKINDYVVVEEEFGQIEEITFYHVVIKLWDLRRLIIPINYFFEKPFQNLSRSSKNLMGSVYFYVDYSFPIDPLKVEFMKILHASSQWDQQVSALQVTDCKENTMEIRALVSARDPGSLWSLRCEIREELLKFIYKQFPSGLPKTRFEVRSDKLDSSQGG